MQRSHFILAFLLIINVQGFAQQYPFDYYTPKDGLINSRVKLIHQDSRGFMYFITRGGLSIYDGARFVNYSLQNGLANEVVNDVIEIAPDSLLVATNISTLNTLVHGKLGVFKTADGFCPVINRFFKSRNGDLYALADEGLFLLRGNRFTRISLLDKENKVTGRYLDRISVWKNYLLLIPWNADLKEKLIVYDTIKKTVIATEMQQEVNSVATDKQGLVWITTNDGVGVLDTIALQKGGIVIDKPPVRFGALNEFKNSIALFDTEGNKWFFNKNLIHRFTPDGEVQTLSSGQGLNTKNISNLFIDREGILWIATDGYGVAKLTNSGVETLTMLNNHTATISSLFQDGNITWVSNAAGNSIFRIQRKSTTIFPLSSSQLNIIGINSDLEKLYLTTPNTLLSISDKNNSTAYRHPEIFFSELHASLGNAVVDPYGNIIIQINKEDISFYTYVISKKKVIYKYTNTSVGDQAALDKVGRLWLITRSGQLLVFSLHPEDPSHYLRLLRDYSNDLPDLNPRSVMIDKNDNVWVGTRYQGILCLELKGLRIDSVLQFNTSNGLTDDFVYTLAVDSSGNIWAGTQSGLDKLIFKNQHYVIGNVSKNNNFFQTIHKIIVTDDNTVWALSGEGTVIKISPSTRRQNGYTPQLVFREMKMDDISFNPVKNNFSHKQNNFSFSVAAPSYQDEKSILYSYLLEGSGNDKWSEPSNQSVFNFINLSPAQYTLKIKCDFPEERYASQVISFPFVINAPWWQTWWFRIVAGLIIIGSLFTIIRFYYNRKLEKARTVLEKQQAIERERTRISIDMHDDLGAGLSRIKFLSETIGIKKQKEEPIEEEISKIREYAHEMIDNMGEIVWALNEKNDSLSDLLSYTRVYAVEYLSQSGIHCEVEAPDTLPTDFVSGEFRRNIYLVVKEALHNVVKHAQANMVKLKIIVNHHLEIFIQDDGVGFDRKNIRPFSNGLMNMEKRMNEIGGTLAIETHDGTTIYIAAPLK